MIWVYILMPVVILGGMAVYFDKKSGATSPDEGSIFIYLRKSLLL
ncbi:hypothetical protein AB7942_27780 [Neobacillus sp. BF23-41]